MTWFYLVLAGIFEVVWATTMKMSEGFSVLMYSVATVVGMILSFAFLSWQCTNCHLVWRIQSGMELAQLAQSLLEWSYFTIRFQE